jgi:protein-S-isoprenylcysteine O-methyltransferase Ste14
VVQILTSPQTLQWLWLAWILYWFANAWRVRRTARRESGGSRLRTMLIVIPAAVLLSYTGLHFGILQRRFVRDSESVRAIGMLLTVAGLGITVWARRHLGQFWSARVTIKEGHELIQSGPYARVRHPIYSGILLALIGTALVIGEWRAVLAVAMVFLAHLDKARREEKLLAEQFGEAFTRHRERTGALLPKLRA